MMEFKDKEVQREYDFLKMQEDDLLNELDRVQESIRIIERKDERE